MNSHWTGVPETLLGGFPEKAPQPPPLISSLSEINEKKAIANQLEIKPIKWQFDLPLTYQALPLHITMPNPFSPKFIKNNYNFPAAPFKAKFGGVI